MRRYIAMLILLCFALQSFVFASNIIILPIDELQKRSQFVIVGTVTNVTEWSEDKDYDIVEVKVGSVLKGKTDAKTFEISLRARGHKGFDPAMKKKQHAVVFLRELKNGKAALTYFGSIAVIPNNNFTLRTPNK